MKKKFTLILMLASTIGVLTTAVLMWNLLYSDHAESIKQTLRISSSVIKSSLESEGAFDQSYFERITASIKERGVRVSYIGSDGNVIYDTNYVADDLNNEKNSPEVILAMKGDVSEMVRVSDDNVETFFYAVRMPSDSSGGYDILRLSSPVANNNSFKLEIIYQVSIAIVAGLLIADVFGFIAVSNFFRPIQNLIDMSKKIASGSFKESIVIQTNDELGILADNFNHMSAEIDKLVSDINTQNYEMQSIMYSMVNGVIALDNFDKILFINPAAIRMLGISEERFPGIFEKEFLGALEGIGIDAFIKKYEIPENISDLVKKSKCGISEIQTSQSPLAVYKVYNNPLVGVNEQLGRLHVLVDITEVKKAELLRKEFVANVSHELKTPLTSIKGFVETLKDGAAENPVFREKFLNIIDFETERLRALIEDMLTLSDIENKRNTNRVVFNAVKSLGEIKIIMDEIASIHGTELNLENDENMVVELYGNPDWFKQMVINLVDNAIKYSSSVEGPKVFFGIRSYDAYDELYVKDNGIGIPKEHMERLFERFYRIDKARSRNIGGSGLGLAIVKHVINSFEAEIIVDSEVAKGSTFTVRIPKNRIIR